MLTIMQRKTYSDEQNAVFGRRVAIFASLLGVCLCGATAISQYIKAEAAAYKARAAEQWTYYQTRTERRMNAQLARDVILAVLNTAPTQSRDPIEHEIERQTITAERYAKEMQLIEDETRRLEQAGQGAELRAYAVDMGSTLMSLSVAFTAFYGTSKRRLFPYLGLGAFGLSMILFIRVFTM
jgi:hypothetical protein